MFEMCEALTPYWSADEGNVSVSDAEAVTACTATGDHLADVGCASVKSKVRRVAARRVIAGVACVQLRDPQLARREGQCQLRSPAQLALVEEHPIALVVITEPGPASIRVALVNQPPESGHSYGVAKAWVGVRTYAAAVVTGSPGGPPGGGDVDGHVSLSWLSRSPSAASVMIWSRSCSGSAPSIRDLAKCPRVVAPPWRMRGPRTVTRVMRSSGAVRVASLMSMARMRRSSWSMPGSRIQCRVMPLRIRRVKSVMVGVLHFVVVLAPRHGAGLAEVGRIDVEQVGGVTAVGVDNVERGAAFQRHVFQAFGGGCDTRDVAVEVGGQGHAVGSVHEPPPGGGAQRCGAVLGQAHPHAACLLQLIHAVSIARQCGFEAGVRGERADTF